MMTVGRNQAYTYIEISDFLNAGLSFSESPKYMIFVPLSLFSRCKRTLSNAKPLSHSNPYTSKNGWLEYSWMNGRSLKDKFGIKFVLTRFWIIFLMTGSVFSLNDCQFSKCL